MGVLPLQYLNGANASSLGLDGSEIFSITGVEELNNGQTPKEVTVTAGIRASKLAFASIPQVRQITIDMVESCSMYYAHF